MGHFVRPEVEGRREWSEMVVDDGCEEGNLQEWWDNMRRNLQITLHN